MKRAMKILETDRLTLRHVVPTDAAFILDLLNQPSFIKYIADRGVRDLDQARDYIETRFAKSYRDHGFGMFMVELKEAQKPLGICGLVSRDTLPHPDIGFAFLPQYWSKGYAFESADAVLNWSRDTLGITRLLAITSKDNESSGRLLERIGLRFERLYTAPNDNEELRLFSIDLDRGEK
jgi:RimJ/RimL family protein N-acetyltransferase